MKVISKKTDYAIRALVSLAKEPGSYHSARHISKKEDIPYQFLRGILKRLTDGGFILSRQGVSGGVKIKGPADTISLGGLIGLFNGRIRISSCYRGNRICGRSSGCLLRKKIIKAEELMIREFNSVMISDLVPVRGEE